jgi:ElaB/YqjD/DUF883 family membrane-anchored ribosome-binding protein
MGTPINRLETIWPKTEDRIPETESRTWSGRAKSWEHKFEVLLAEHPKVAIAAAAGLGIVLGWMVKRK